MEILQHIYSNLTINWNSIDFELKLINAVCWNILILRFFDSWAHASVNDSDIYPWHSTSSRCICLCVCDIFCGRRWLNVMNSVKSPEITCYSNSSHEISKHRICSIKLIFYSTFRFSWQSILALMQFEFNTNRLWIAFFNTDWNISDLIDYH